jgi:hypothetical protein
MGGKAKALYRRLDFFGLEPYKVLGSLLANL